ncbi:MAG: hypothetical protein GXP44_02025 [bacterium]|nr:hypothetical protein [bacterium]
MHRSRQFRLPCPAVAFGVGGRYYDPELGRFITRDPSGYPDGPNNYLYYHNNPINFVDPLGLREQTKDEKKKIESLKQFEKKVESKQNAAEKRAQEAKKSKNLKVEKKARKEAKQHKKFLTYLLHF